MEILSFILCLIVFVCGAGFAWTILQPFAQAVRGCKRPTRFVTSDFLYLMVLLTLPLVFLSDARRWADASRIQGAGGLLIAVFVYAWWRGAATLSGVGIYQPSKRGIFLVVILPLAIVGSVVAVPALVATTILLFGGFHRGGWSDWLIWLVGAVGLPVVALLFRSLSKWTLKDSQCVREYP